MNILVALKMWKLKGKLQEAWKMNMLKSQTVQASLIGIAAAVFAALSTLLKCFEGSVSWDCLGREAPVFIGAVALFWSQIRQRVAMDRIAAKSEGNSEGGTK